MNKRVGKTHLIEGGDHIAVSGNGCGKNMMIAGIRSLNEGINILHPPIGQSLVAWSTKSRVRSMAVQSRSGWLRKSVSNLYRRKSPAGCPDRVRQRPTAEKHLARSLDRGCIRRQGQLSLSMRTESHIVSLGIASQKSLFTFTISGILAGHEVFYAGAVALFSLSMR